MRFACQPGCTKCCSRRGWVYLTESDLLSTAEYLGMTPAAFEAEHVIRYRRVLRLRKPARGEDNCRFLKADGCSIHKVKPTQCRTYPYWPSIVESHGRWNLEALFCPGIGKGKLIQIKKAQEIAKELPLAYPSLGEF